MKISVELTLTPLQDEFDFPIINFIKALRASNLTVIENALSTQIYGDYNEVMGVLNKEIEIALQAINNGVMLIKIVKGNRSNYEPHF